jgi:hypothetical protein
VITVTPDTALQSSAFRENPDALESIDLKHARLPEVDFAARPLVSGVQTQWRKTFRPVIRLSTDKRRVVLRHRAARDRSVSEA